MDIFEQMESDAAKLTRAPTDEELSTLTRLGLELVQIDERLTKYKAVAEELESRKKHIQTVEMVDLMDTVGQDVVGLPEQNVDLVLSDYVKAGLPNPSPEDPDYEQKMALRQSGLLWLSENADGLISTTLIVKMPKGSLPLATLMQETIASLFGYGSTPESRRAHAEKLLSTLEERNEPGIDPGSVSVDEGVHWATLTSFVKEQAVEKKRVDLPLDALGATIGRIVKIVKRRKKK